MRKTFVDTITELAEKDPKVMLVIGDTGFSVFEEFEKTFGERFINVGIAEQNFVGISAGLAAMGMRPFAYNVVSFMTQRAMEQIVLDICYQENPVILVGVGGGFAYGTAGPTHHSTMDIAMMRSIPGMSVICPGDPAEMRQAVLKTYEMNKPAYIRIGRSIDPPVHTDPIDKQFKIGKALKVMDGNDIAIFVTGCMLKEAVRVCEMLIEKGISPCLYSMHTIKPIDREEILKCTSKYDAIFTIEEHSSIGGLGGAVAEILAQEKIGRSAFKIYAVQDSFAPVTGSRDYLLDLFGLSPNRIVDDMMKIIEKD